VAKPNRQGEGGGPEHPGPTADQQKKIVYAIQLGNYTSVAVEAASVARSTFYAWMRRGRTGEEPYASFRNAVRAAEAVAEASAIQVIRGAAQKQWQAAAWFLERKFPDRWGRKDRTEHSIAPHAPGAQGRGVTVQVVYDSDPPERPSDPGAQGPATG
jgi:hypothetical protein